MKILRKLWAWWRAWWNRERGVTLVPTLEPTLEVPRCDVPDCGRPGVFNVGDPGDHRACVRHAEQVVDLLLAGFSDAFQRCQKKEEEGEFLPTDTSRCFEVYKSKGRMGPSAGRLE